MDDKRNSPRMRTLLSGKIILGGGGVIDCVLRNRSETGARLKIESVVGIPDRFTLAIDSVGEARLVRVVWRKHNEIGVEFDVA